MSTNRHRPGVPFELEEGWPSAIAGEAVIACEAGIMLGAIYFSEATLQALKGTGVLSLRIDEHEEVDGWTSRQPNGRAVSSDFIIPTLPLEVPDKALQTPWSFVEWAMDSHGSLGRLLLWDAGADWWILNEPDLELTLMCSERKFSEEFEQWVATPFEWVNEDFWTEEGIRTAEDLSRKYSLGWCE